MNKVLYILFFLSFGLIIPISAQDLSLFQQLNGRYDYTSIGNTLNPSENNVSEFFAILETSSASFSLDSRNLLVKAYLYSA